MEYQDYLSKADETITIRFDKDNIADSAIFVLKDSMVIVFPSIIDMINHRFLGVANVERFYMGEDEFETISKSTIFDYTKLKEKFINLKTVSVEIMWKDDLTEQEVLIGVGDFNESIDEKVFYWVDDVVHLKSLQDPDGVEEFTITKILYL